MKNSQIESTVKSVLSKFNAESPVYLLVTGKEDEGQVVGKWLSGGTTYSGNEAYSISNSLQQNMKVGKPVETENGYGQAIIVRDFGPLIISAAGNKDQAKIIVEKIVRQFSVSGLIQN